MRDGNRPRTERKTFVMSGDSSDRVTFSLGRKMHTGYVARQVGGVAAAGGA